jgi:ABC-type iron transport system FetAB ATPase subunit
MQNSILQPVISHLEKNGATEDQIADIIADLTQAATVTLYSQIMQALSEDDLKQIEEISSEEDADKRIAELYLEKTGAKPEEVMQVYLKKFVDDFLSQRYVSKS